MMLGVRILENFGCREDAVCCTGIGCTWLIERCVNVDQLRFLEHSEKRKLLTVDE